MSAAPVSLVIVSQGRPEHLAAMLKSLIHQTHPNFEIVLVADHLPNGYADRLHFIPFTDANISKARNIGIERAACEIIAFCDDDAIPDPTWLERLTAPFTQDRIGSATGFTRGRNGISRQWGAMRFDRNGEDAPFDIDESQPFTVFDANPDNPVKLLGTNMAFRKSALHAIGGFDEAFRFFLDETDVKLRLDQNDWKTAIVPRAQVHHHFAPSPRRAKNRAPTDLYEIGASKAYFLTKHSHENPDTVLSNFETEQRLRLRKFRLRKRETSRVITTLVKGIKDGLSRVGTNSLNTSRRNFFRFETETGPHVVLCVGPFDQSWQRSHSSELLKDGCCVSVIQILPSIRYFQVNFQNGYWLHKGGVYGKSERHEPILKIRRASTRLRKEIERISEHHRVDTVSLNPRGVLKRLVGNKLLRKNVQPKR